MDFMTLSNAPSSTCGSVFLRSSHNDNMQAIERTHLLYSALTLSLYRKRVVERFFAQSSYEKHRAPQKLTRLWPLLLGCSPAPSKSRTRVPPGPMVSRAGEARRGEVGKEGHRWRPRGRQKVGGAVAFYVRWLKIAM